VVKQLNSTGAVFYSYDVELTLMKDEEI